MATERPIGIITAVPFEADILLRETKRKRPLGRFTTGRLAGRRVVVITGGIGAANAANAATLLIGQHTPKAVIQTGIGGAYPGGGAVLGDIVAAEQEVYADLGVLTKEGFQDMKSTGLALLERDRKKYYRGRTARARPETRCISYGIHGNGHAEARTGTPDAL
jgi:futalosine hydrolase